MTANRVAAAGGAVAAVAAAAVSVLGAVDSTAKALVLSVALACVAVVVVVFLLGSQKWDALKVNAVVRSEAAAALAKAQTGLLAPLPAEPSAEASDVPVNGPRDTEVGQPDPSAAREDLDSVIS